MAHVLVCWLFIWSRRPLEWAFMQWPSCCSKIPILPVSALTVFTRHSNTPLHLQAWSTRSPRLLALVMHIFMGCDLWQKLPLHILPPRSDTFDTIHCIHSPPVGYKHCCGMFTTLHKHKAHYSRLRSTLVPSVACQTTEGKYHSTNPFLPTNTL